MSPSLVDFLGNAIQVGDLIVYPVRRRTAMTLKKATVTEIGNSALKQGIRCVNDNGRSVIMSSPERCVIVKRLGD